jgi:hypothetical protein
LTFCIGAGANAGRAILMRLSGQRIIARVRCVSKRGLPCDGADVRGVGMKRICQR